jgi:hypothetical protein
VPYPRNSWFDRSKSDLTAMARSGLYHEVVLVSPIWALTRKALNVPAGTVTSPKDSKVYGSWIPPEQAHHSLLDEDRIFPAEWTIEALDRGPFLSAGH